MARSIDSVLSGRRVDSVTGGPRLTLRLSGAIEVCVENDFRLSGPTEVEHFYPGLGMRPSGGLPGLVGAHLTAVRVTTSGALVLAFDTRHTLTVAPDPTPGGPDHAWTVTGPTGPLFTALPGGYLTA